MELARSSSAGLVSPEKGRPGVGGTRVGKAEEPDRRARPGDEAERGATPHQLLDAVLQGVAAELLLAVEMELPEDVADVVLHRLLGDEQAAAISL